MARHPLDLDAATWGALDRLLDAALDLPPSEREAWLAALPPEAQRFAPRLRGLLAGAKTPGPPLALPRVEGGTTDATGEAADEGAAAPGERVGPYRLVRMLGQGGMGAVWLAERADGMVQRQVALKLPRGLWARPGLQERMAREREILAGLEHPHIARLYDAGVDEGGRPWLALEYVEGRPIDVHAREAGLDLRARLGLFLQVAEAVAHAHARLVVHRDLKPGNVLVTASGEVRLLDFGIAKLLDQGAAQETELTRLAGRALTPAYASPEQILGETIGVASDVYSLGVLLCELLTGHGPYRLERPTAAAMEEAVLRGEPARPSELCADRALGRQLRGDLDTIVLRALRKRPAERYASVDAFREDVERWLAGQPVRAQPDRLGYRARKFVGRHRLAVAAASVTLLAVVGGAGVALWQARAARVEQRRAEEVKEFIAGIFRDADPYGGKRSVSAGDLLRQARLRVDAIAASQVALRVELLAVLGESFLGLQEIDGAESALREAVAVGGPGLGEDHPLVLRARTLGLRVDRYRGRTGELRAELTRLLPVLRRAAPALAEERAIALNARGHLLIDEGRFPEAVEAATEALAAARAKWGPRHADVVANQLLLGLAYQYARRPAEALAASEEGLRLAEAVHGAGHPKVVDARSIHGRALADAGQVERGLGELVRATEEAAAIFGPRAAMVGYFASNAGTYQAELGRVQEALASSLRALEILEPQTVPGSYSQAAALANRAAALLAARRGAPALDLAVRAVDAMERALGPESDKALAVEGTRVLALAHSGRTDEALQAARKLAGRARLAKSPGHRPWLAAGTAARLAGAPGEARAFHAEALAAVGPDPRSARSRPVLQAEAGLDALELGLLDEAGAALAEARRELAALQPQPSPDRAGAALGLGRVRLAEGRPAEALPLLAEADGFWRSPAAAGADGRWAGEAALWLGRCQRALGQQAEARASLARADSLLARSPLPGDTRLAALARER